jgi:hypothetical protein
MRMHLKGLGAGKLSECISRHLTKHHVRFGDATLVVFELRLLFNSMVLGYLQKLANKMVEATLVQSKTSTHKRKVQHCSASLSLSLDLRKPCSITSPLLPSRASISTAARLALSAAPNFLSPNLSNVCPYVPRRTLSRDESIV